MDLEDLAWALNTLKDEHEQLEQELAQARQEIDKLRQQVEQAKAAMREMVSAIKMTPVGAFTGVAILAADHELKRWLKAQEGG